MLFRRRPAEPTIADRLLGLMADPTGWTNENRQYRHPSCSFMVLAGSNYASGRFVTVFLDQGRGETVPLTSREHRQLIRATDRIDGSIRDRKRASALALFDAECAI